MLALLGRAEAALRAGDVTAADAAMAAGAALCERMAAGPVTLAEPIRQEARDLRERCADLLGRLASELNAAGFDGENRRRGLASYARR